MSELVLSMNNVSKSYKSKVAVRQASLEVNSGEIFGLIGPIDSGKSTIIRMVCGLVQPTAGKVEICGKNIVDDFEDAVGMIGGSLENSSVYLNMTGKQNLKYYAGMYDKMPVMNQRIESVSKFLGIYDKLNDVARNYTKDDLQKLTIAQALLHYPKLLILDEPTNGLNENSIVEMRNFLKKVIKKYNIAVLVGSNNLSEMELLCDTVGIISGGEILDIKTIKEIQDGIKLGQKVAFKVNYPNFGAKIIKEKYSINPRSVGSEIIFQLPEDQIPDVTSFLISNNIAVFGVRTIIKTIEEVFVEIVNRQRRKSQLK